MTKLTLAVHKFTSCDGCQLAFLNAGEKLLTLFDLTEITHFAEAGQVNLEKKVDVAIIEGSISTPEEKIRINKIRQNSKFVITIGACATSGGLQALRNITNSEEWVKSIYTNPEHIKTLKTSTAISEHIKVNSEIWGCPVNTEQVLDAIRSLLSNATPRIKHDSVCIECKRKGNVCVLITKKQPCMGPVTQTGCGALCPTLGRACYACYGPKENSNSISLGRQFEKFGFKQESISQQFSHINNNSIEFKKAHNHFKGIKIVKK